MGKRQPPLLSTAAARLVHETCVKQGAVFMNIAAAMSLEWLNAYG